MLIFSLGKDVDHVLELELLPLTGPPKATVYLTLPQRANAHESELLRWLSAFDRHVSQRQQHR
jgi:hypothetical protein